MDKELYEWLLARLNISLEFQTGFVHISLDDKIFNPTYGRDREFIKLITKDREDCNSLKKVLL